MRRKPEPVQTPAIDRLSPGERDIVVKMLARALLAQVLREGDDVPADARFTRMFPSRERTGGTV
jgi:hypothetical protein